jgi:SSS family solute:Na+ symporter
MVAGFIANHGTYMHSWGSIFIQDVILPLRKQSLTAGQHLIFLRLSVAGVTVFIFLFSLFYKPNEAVLMFFALTGSIFIGGSGAVLIGGLYWKRGTTAGAWSALAVGAAISIGAFILRELWPTIFGSDFPINSQWIYAITMISSTTVYVIVSLVQNRIFNLDKMLNRGIYAESELNESQSPNTNSGTLLKNVINKLGLSKEFTGGDKILFYATLFWSIGWFVVFIFGMAYNWLNPIPDNAWLKLWAAKVIIAFLLGAVCTVWISIGGIRDLRFMFHALGTASRDHKDDGTVADLYERKKNVQQEVQSEMLDK